jgi:carboxyl-terminal processing protease
VITRSLKVLIALHLILIAGWATAASLTAAQKKLNLDAFEVIWTTLKDRYWDKTMAGLDWQSIHAQYMQQVKAANSSDEAQNLMIRMIRLLPSSHLTIIPGSIYPTVRDADTPNGPVQDGDDEDTDRSGSTGLTLDVIGERVVVEAVGQDSGGSEAAVRPGWIIDSVGGAEIQTLFAAENASQRNVRDSLITELAEESLNGPVGSHVVVRFINGEGKSVKCDIVRKTPPGELVSFWNLPPERVRMEHRRLEGGLGYIRLNLFLDPLKVMPEVEKAIEEFRDAPGIVLDLRNNPGGLGMMAMGIAGWFVSEDGKRLGTMTGRDETTNFTINPRLHAYQGRVAVLVNGGSASTSEILAQGLKDLGRARIFGTRTAGAALPSNIIRLPNGDRFQYPEASYTSMKGRVLEGNGVEPNVVVAPTIQALLAGRDLPLQAASAWCKEKP